MHVPYYLFSWPFLDMSKAFFKVWHEWFIFKLKSTMISKALLELTEFFLKNRFQGAVLMVRRQCGYQQKQIYLKDLF